MQLPTTIGYLIFKKIHFIINPASGNDEPILSWINDIFGKTKIEWEVFVTKKKSDARKFTRDAIKQKVDCVAVYGGDGTVMEVAQELFQKDMPMAIIPGGTANVVAKELGIPVDTRSALALLKGRAKQIKEIDMGLCNKKPFVIRLNAGIMADMIKKTESNVKESIGQLAYAVTALKELGMTKIVTYDMVIDGKKKKTKGFALVVANSGNVGISDISLLPSVDISDGFLDVIVFKTNRLTSLIKWAANIAMQSKPIGVVRHWKAKDVVITTRPAQSLLLDDVPYKAETIHAEIVPKALRVVVPK